MSDVNRDPVRWERSMTQDKEGQYVAFHDYALLLDAHDTLRARLSEAQARLAEIERQEPVCVIEVKNGGGALIAGSLDRGTHKLYAAPVAPAAQAQKKEV